MDQYEIAHAALENKQSAVAERGYAAILKRSPRDVRATRGMAIARFQQRRFKEAVTLMRRAVELDPADAESPTQLGEIYLALGENAKALAVLEKACDKHVGSVLAWGTLLKVYRALGRGDEIVPRMLRALDENPESSDLMLHIGNLYGRLGDHANANAMFTRMTTQKYSNPEGLLQLANSRYFLKAYDEAYAAYEDVLLADPNRAFAQSQKGNIRIAQKRPQDAVNDFAAALRIDPNCYDALVGMGAALWELNRLDEALTFLEAALGVQPRGVAAFNNIGQVMAAYKADADAITMFDRVHAIEPESKIDARISAATSSLRMGNFEDGWRRYEHRLTMEQTPVVDPAQYAAAQRWNGEDLAGKTLLIVPEQGMGDTIQFCRYVPLVAQRTNAQVVFAVNRPLFALLEGKQGEWAPAGNLRIVAHDDVLPACTHFVPLMSLPMIFGTRVETIPAAQRYLTTPESYRQKWSTKLPESGRLRVGLAWAGNPNHMNDRRRSMPIQHLAPLVGDTSVDWYVLHPTLTAHDQQALATVPHVLKAGSHIQDFSDTAALIERLDVVVCVDTSVAHLAGALGKPVFLMVPWAAEWRWFHDRTDSPWYPSVRVFRQPSLGDWSGVIDQVQQALIAFHRERTSTTASFNTTVRIGANVALA